MIVAAYFAGWLSGACTASAIIGLGFVVFFAYRLLAKKAASR